MNQRRLLPGMVVAIFFALGVIVFTPQLAPTHCDTLDGKCCKISTHQGRER